MAKGPVRKPRKPAPRPKQRVRTTKLAPSSSGTSLFDRLASTEVVDDGLEGRFRLNHFMAQCGVASRRASDELIEQGRVSVNGAVTKELGLKIDPIRDRVEVDGSVLKPEKPTYVVLHKPKGFVCTSATREQKPRAIDLVASVRGRLFSVGRLDLDSEGLLIFTNDGAFADRLTHPRYGVPENYEVVVRGRVDPEELDKLRGGIWLAEGRTSGARIRIRRRGAERTYLDVEIREGKNREVRRLFSRIGYPVLRLKRTSIGPITIRGLASGRYRFLTNAEINGLLAASSEEEALDGAAEQGGADARPSGQRGRAPRPEGKRSPRGGTQSAGGRGRGRR